MLKVSGMKGEGVALKEKRWCEKWTMGKAKKIRGKKQKVGKREKGEVLVKCRELSAVVGVWEMTRELKEKFYCTEEKQ
jgi:hypothetical protein